ncbi:uncharacterized protein LOC144885232 [Branchiostoma floridae x Branchiostoma japonicum]
MTGCDNQHRRASDSDENGHLNPVPTDDSTEDVQFWHEAEEGAPLPREDFWHSVRVLGRKHRGEYGVRTKIARQTLCHSWPQQHSREHDIGIERRNTMDNSPANESVKRTDIDFSDIKSYENHPQRGFIENVPSTCKLWRTELTVQSERHSDDGTVPAAKTHTDSQTDSDPSHESLEEYRAYVAEVRRAGRQNFAKQTADLVRRTLQAGNWEDIVRQVTLPESQVNQFLCETLETTKEESMVIYDKHIQDKGSPQRLYILQEALVKRAILSLSRRCKGMSNCA